MEEAEDETSFSPGSSIANDTQFNKDLINRLLTSSPPRQPSPPVNPTQPPEHQRFGQPKDLGDAKSQHHRPPGRQESSTTTTVPLNDHSSPNLPPLPTQHSIHPASLPHPSQISTQDPTQPYLSMSSMPLPHLSSSIRRRPVTVTIKDSSSVPIPLHDIPLQRQSQSQALIHGGLEEDDNSDDGYLDPASDDAADVAEEQESQLGNVPIVHRKVEVDQSQVMVPSSPPRVPLPMQFNPRDLGISESLLESLPSPPGWSQRSWDDEPLFLDRR